MAQQRGGGTPHSHAIESMREYFASNLASLDVESIKADPYLSKIGEMWHNNGGGGGTLRRVGFGAKNGDCGARATVTYAKYALLHALAKHHFYHPNPTASDFAPQNSQSPNFSSTILESFGCLLTFLAFPKADSSPKILESKSSENHKTRRSRSFFSKSTASDFNLESTFDKSTISLSSQAYFPFLSSRDFRKEVVAIHNKKVDSSNDYSASAEFMDCHATATQCLAMTENNTTSENEDSRENAKNVSKQPKDSRSEAQNLKTPAKDSRISTQNAPSVAAAVPAILGSPR